ncbi:MAG: SGNH/GDSL hydrolase family protein [Paracoccaceae bacterium]
MRQSILSAVVISSMGAVSYGASYHDLFTGLIVTGDSLADDGKFGALAPPSADGQFSNEDVYAKRLAQDFVDAGKAAVNLALAGATAGNTNTTVYPTELASVTSQISTLAGQAGVIAQGYADPAIRALAGMNPLVSIQFGGNDIMQQLFDGADGTTIGFDAADAVSDGIRGIASIDSTLFDDYLVFNLGNLARTPRFAGTNLQDEAGAASTAFNARLQENITALLSEGLNVQGLNLFGTLENIGNNPSAFGITDTTGQCIESFFSTDLTNNCAVDLASGAVNPDNANDFFFVDDVHPSGTVHEEIAAQVRSQLAPVPLPAGMPLMLAGVAVFGVMRLRKSK